MSGLPLSRPETMGIDAPRLQRAWDLLQTWIDADKVPAAGVCVGRKGFMVEPRLLGRQRPEGTAPCARTRCSWWPRSPSRSP